MDHLTRRLSRQPPIRRRALYLPLSELGYTILELIIVLGLMALAAAMAIPRIDSTRWQLNGAVREVAGLLRYARQTAVRQQHDVVVSFEAATNSVVVHENSDNDPAARVAAGERVYRRPLPEGIVFSSGARPPLRGRTGSPVSFQSATLVFHGNGAASESGVIYLEIGNPEAGVEDVRALWVERATGAVEAFRFRSGEWGHL